MEKPKSEIAIPVRSSSYADLNVPGVIVELDAAAAEELGAFEETALSEAEAWESNTDLALEEASRG